MVVDVVNHDRSEHLDEFRVDDSGLSAPIQVRLSTYIMGHTGILVKNEM